MESSCKHGRRPVSFINQWKFPDQSNDYQLFKYEIVPQRMLVC
jgi:hypothetical protein